MIAALLVLTLVPTGEVLGSAPRAPVDLGSAGNFVIRQKQGSQPPEPLPSWGTSD